MRSVQRSEDPGRLLKTLSAFYQALAVSTESDNSLVLQLPALFIAAPEQTEDFVRMLPKGRRLRPDLARRFA